MQWHVKPRQETDEVLVILRSCQRLFRPGSRPIDPLNASLSQRAPDFSAPSLPQLRLERFLPSPLRCPGLWSPIAEQRDRAVVEGLPFSLPFPQHEVSPGTDQLDIDVGHPLGRWLGWIE